MISRCANPACNKPFHYLRGGRLYRFDGRTTSANPKAVANAVYTVSPTHMSVFFWLCKECSSKLLLRFDGSSVAVVPAQVFGGDRDTPVIPSGTFGTERTNLHEIRGIGAKQELGSTR